MNSKKSDTKDLVQRSLNLIWFVLLAWIAASVWHIARRDGTAWDAECWLVYLSLTTWLGSIGHAMKAVMGSGE